MKKVLLLLIRSAICLTILFVTGCASVPNVKLAQDDKSFTTKSLAIIVPQQEPKTNVDLIYKSKTHGLVGGAEGGALFGLAECVSGGPVGIVMSPACVVVGGAAGAVIGYIKAPTAEEFTASKKTLKEGTKSVQEIFQLEMQSILRENKVVNQSSLTQKGVLRKENYRELSLQGIETLLIAGLTKIEINKVPPRLEMEAQTRLIQASNNKELFSGKFIHYENVNHVKDLTENLNHLATRLGKGNKILAKNIHERIFMLYTFKNVNVIEEKRGIEKMNECSTLFCQSVFGLAPDYPPTDVETEVETLTPTLHWKPFPRKSDIEKKLNRITDIRYDFILSEAIDSHLKNIFFGRSVGGVSHLNIIYRKEGLRDTSHKIEMLLKPSTSYHWSVRARFRLDDHERVTEWSGFEWIENRMNDRFVDGKYFTGITSNSYRFSTPSE